MDLRLSVFFFIKQRERERERERERGDRDFFIKQRERETERQRQTDRQTDRQTNGHPVCFVRIMFILMVINATNLHTHTKINGANCFAINKRPFYINNKAIVNNIQSLKPL